MADNGDRKTDSRLADGVLGFLVSVVASLVALLILRLPGLCTPLWSKVAVWLFASLMGFFLFATLRSRFRNGLQSVIPYLLVIVIVLCALELVGQIEQCPYRGDDLNETAQNLIEAEAAAVMTRNITTIEKIFFDGAVVEDVKLNKRVDVSTHYTNLFASCQFLNVTPYNIELARQRKDLHIFTSGTNISYRCNSEPPVEKINPPGSSEWTLAQDECGCWRIKHFRFNLHLAFDR